MKKPKIQILGKSDVDDGCDRDQGVSEMKYTGQYMHRWVKPLRASYTSLVSAPAGPCIWFNDLARGETMVCSGAFLI